MVLLSAQGMDIAQVARVAFRSPDRVRDVIKQFQLSAQSAPAQHQAQRPAAPETNGITLPLTLSGDLRIRWSGQR